MANKLYDDTKIQTIADAIRAKNSSTATYKVGEMAEAILSIPTGGDTTIISSLLTNGESAALSVYDLSELDISFLKSFAFYNFQNQKVPNVIKLPNSILSIGSYSFDNCKYTTRIELPVRLTSIENNAFNGCTSLALNELPAGVTSIGNNAFNGCTSLALNELPAGVTSIGTYTFNGCTSLALNELPAGVTSIGNYAFNGCTSLALNELPAGVTSIGNYAFNGCTSLALNELPAGVTSIGSYAFSGCSAISAMNIPYIAKDLESYAFQGCTSLKTLKSKCVGIKTWAFANCTELTKVWIGSQCTYIPATSQTKSPFYNCKKMKNIYCEASNQPSAWGIYWNYSSTSSAEYSFATVHWGVTEEEFDELDETTEDTTE